MGTHAASLPTADAVSSERHQTVDDVASSKP
jgi:hypothetical protein